MLACKVLGAVMLQGGPLSSTRQRRALAALVVAHGEVVSADRLADIVWDGDPPGSMNALQTYMSRLRAVLGVDSIQTRPPGYALALPIDAVDAWRFETLVDEARSMPPVEALDLLDEALGLWRGKAYAEFAHEEFARAEAVRLEELRAAAAVARLDALIGVGRADDAAADALHLIEADPFRESVWDRRMRALHASGRTVDALRVFQDYRRLLADELGLEPSPELVALERALLTPQSPKQSADTTLGAMPGNLPVDSTALVDRAEIDPLVEGSRGLRPSGTVTFLFTDIEGSTALWEQDDSMGVSLAEHDQLLLSTIRDHGGYVFASGGDGFAAAFSDPVAALRAAIETRAGLRLPVRMGLHTGTADERDGNYFGKTLNRGMRVMAAGHGGQILMSDATASLVCDETRLTDLGVHRVAGLGAPLRLWQVGVEQYPALKTADGTPTVARRTTPALPVSLFVGRDDDAARVAALLDSCRIVTVCGPGGVGKTRLVRHVAHAVAERYDDGVIWVDFSSSTRSGGRPGRSGRGAQVERAHR